MVLSTTSLSSSIYHARLSALLLLAPGRGCRGHGANRPHRPYRIVGGEGRSAQRPHPTPSPTPAGAASSRCAGTSCASHQSREGSIGTPGGYPRIRFSGREYRVILARMGAPSFGRMAGDRKHIDREMRGRQRPISKGARVSGGDRSQEQEPRARATRARAKSDSQRASVPPTPTHLQGWSERSRNSFLIF